MLTTERAPAGGRHRTSRERATSPARPRRSGRAPTARVAARGPAEGAWSRPWQPLSGSALLDRLRITGRARPAADPSLAEALRSRLEAGIVGHPAQGSTTPAGPGDEPGARSGTPVPSGPLVVTRERLTAALCCAAHDPGPAYGGREPSSALACGALVSVLFRQLVTVGRIDDAMADGTAALSLDEDRDGLVSWIERLPAAAREELRTEVERQADALCRRWPTFEPSWLPRTDETMQVSLASGEVLLSARVDLVVGRPAEGEASVALVEVVSGARRAVHVVDRHFAALVETLRHDAPPFVTATYYTRTGELDAEPVTDGMLASSARRVVAGVGSLRRRVRGEERVGAPAASCIWCAASPWSSDDVLGPGER